MTRGCANAVLLAAAAIVPAITAAQKMTPEELVKLHVQGLTLPGRAAAGTGQGREGAVSAMTPARAAGLCPARSRCRRPDRLAPDHAVRYRPLRRRGVHARSGKVDIANADPRNGSRSAIGNFLARNLVIVSEGLLGGTLNTRWPLLDVAGRARITMLKTLGGRELHRLRYRAKDNQGSLEVELYFDPATYRHVASVYSSSQAQALGATTIDRLRRPTSIPDRRAVRKVRADRHAALPLVEHPFRADGNTANEWKCDLTVQTIEVTGPKGSQPRAGAVHRSAGGDAVNAQFGQTLASSRRSGSMANETADRARGAHRRARDSRRPFHRHAPADRLHGDPVRCRIRRRRGLQRVGARRIAGGDAPAGQPGRADSRALSDRRGDLRDPGLPAS